MMNINEAKKLRHIGEILPGKTNSVNIAINTLRTGIAQ